MVTRQTITAKNPKLPASCCNEALSWLLFGIIVINFLVLKSYGIHWQVGDENVYTYMAWAWIDHSALPYADYFFAHPLLHLLPGIPVFKLMGFTPLSMRIIPVTATVISAFFLFLLARRELGRVGAVATIFLYLTAFSLLRASTHWTGINLSVMWIVIGLWAFTRRRSFLAGVCMAVGVCTGNYVLPAAIMTGLLALLQSRKNAWRYIIGFTVPWALVQSFSFILGGQSYLDTVYRYHVHKPDKKGIFWYRSVQVFTSNKALFLGTLFGSMVVFLNTFLSENSTDGTNEYSSSSSKKISGLLVIWQWLRKNLIENSEKPIALISVLWVVGYLLFISMLSNVYPFYFLLMFPAMALIGGYAVDRYVYFLTGMVKKVHRRANAFGKDVSIAGIITAAIILSYAAMAPLQHKFLPDYERKTDKQMKWSDAPLPAFVNNLLHTCCFDDVAKAYTDYTSIQELLYHESRFFKKAKDLARYVKENSAPDQTLFGDAGTTGLIAILSERRIQADFVDTNNMRFTSRITSIEDTISLIDKKELAFIIVSGSIYRGKKGKFKRRYYKFAGLPRFRLWLHQNFHVVYRTRDPYNGWYFILQKNVNQRINPDCNFPGKQPK